MKNFKPTKFGSKFKQFNPSLFIYSSYSHNIAAVVNILIFKKDSCFSLDMPNGLNNTVEPIFFFFLESIRKRKVKIY